MTTPIQFRPGALQQQPRRAVNQQQQQSSGSGEFQPPRKTPTDQASAPGRDRPAYREAAEPV